MKFKLIYKFLLVLILLFNLHKKKFLINLISKIIIRYRISQLLPTFFSFLIQLKKYQFTKYFLLKFFSKSSPVVVKKYIHYLFSIHVYLGNYKYKELSFLKKNNSLKNLIPFLTGSFTINNLKEFIQSISLDKEHSYFLLITRCIINLGDVNLSNKLILYIEKKIICTKEFTNLIPSKKTIFLIYFLRLLYVYGHKSALKVYLKKINPSLTENLYSSIISKSREDYFSISDLKRVVGLNKVLFKNVSASNHEVIVPQPDIVHFFFKFPYIYHYAKSNQKKIIYFLVDHRLFPLISNYKIQNLKYIKFKRGDKNLIPYLSTIVDTKSLNILKKCNFSKIPYSKYRFSKKIVESYKKGWIKNINLSITEKKNFFIDDNKINIGISLGSTLKRDNRSIYDINLDEIKFLNSKKYNLISLQPNLAKKDTQKYFSINIPKFDLFNDFVNLTKLIGACDYVICNHNNIMDISGAVGTKTFVISRTHQMKCWSIKGNQYKISSKVKFIYTQKEILGLKKLLV